MSAPRKPTAVRLDAPDVRVASPGAEAPILFDKPVVVVPEEVVEPEPPPPAIRPRRRGPWAALFFAAAGLLVSLGAGLSVARLVEEAFARAPALGYAALGLALLALLAFLVLIGRELAGLARLSRVERLRERASAILLSDDRADGRALSNEIVALYAHRPDTAAARAEFARHRGDILDGADMVRLTERTLLADLDREAVRRVTESAKRVSLVTAVAPRAVFDVAMVLFESARLVRALADLYGARPGGLGAWRLARAVLGHLAVTGGLAAGESLVEQLLGQGLAAKLSARLGEGVVNGLMTARVGLAALDLVRPLPFTALERPKLGAILAEIAKVGR